MKDTKISIGLEEIYLVVCFAISMNCGKPLEFLYSFGETLFSVLTGDRGYLTVSKLVSFGKFIGVNERVL